MPVDIGRDNGLSFHPFNNYSFSSPLPTHRNKPFSSLQVLQAKLCFERFPFTDAKVYSLEVQQKEFDGFNRPSPRQLTSNRTI